MQINSTVVASPKRKQSTTNETLLRIRNLTKHFPLHRADARIWAKPIRALLGWTTLLNEFEAFFARLPVLRGVDLDVFANETIAITGTSGAGKSTLLHLIAGLDRPSKGTILYQNDKITGLSESKRTSWRNHNVGFVFQFFQLFPDLTAFENVLLPAMVARSKWSYLKDRRSIHDRAKHLLELVGLADRSRHYPKQLSGGEQQRVAIARALMLNPRLLLCDEPTGNLDQTTSKQIMDLLFELRAQSKHTMIIVTHDKTVAERADRVIKLIDGKIA